MLRGYLACVALGAGGAVLLLAGARSVGWLGTTKECVDTPAPKASAPAFASVGKDGAKAGAEELRKRLGASRRVVFRSNDGIAYRRDDDWEVTFEGEPDRNVDILHFGVALVHYQGKYELREDGRVMLVGSPGENFPLLPELVLQSLRGGLFLLPSAMSPELARRQTWYFRMLTGDDEQEALSDLRQYRTLE